MTTIDRERHQRGLACPVGARLDVPFWKTGRVIALGTSCCAPTENGSSPFVIPNLQSVIPNPQSVIPNPQSVIPNPQPVIPMKMGIQKVWAQAMDPRFRGDDD